MKQLFIFLLLTALAFGQSSTVPIAQQNSQKAKALIDQAIAALGGNAYLNIQDISQEGRTYSFHLGVPNSVGIVFWRFYKYPDHERIEVTKKRDVIYVFNGDNAYEITYKGTREQDAKDLAEYRRRRPFALDRILREWTKDPSVALFYEGGTVADQKDAQQVTLMNSHDEGVTLYIDSTTHLPIKKSFTWRDPTDKQRNVEEEVYDNYRPVQGIMTPFTITRYYNGDMSNQRFFTVISYNKSLADAMFEASVPSKPAGK